MTQPPLGQNPSGSGAFDEPGPGNPDITPADGEATVTGYPGTPYADTPDTPYAAGAPETPYGETGYVGTTSTESYPASTESSSGSGGKVDQAKGQAKEVAGTAKGKAQEVAGTAKGEAKQVADTAVASGKEVAQTAKEEAANVVAETKHQVASLFDTVRTELGQQATTQQSRIAEAVHSMSKELGSMAANSSESGPLTDLAQQASRRGGEIAHWLQDKEPADVLESVRSYARRRPGAFLLICGLAGVVAGRLTRSTVATRTSLDSKDDSDRSSSDLDRGSNYTVQPVMEPGTYAAGGYGTAVESTEIPATPQYDPTQTGVGYDQPGVGYDQPGGDLTR